MSKNHYTLKKRKKIGGGALGTRAGGGGSPAWVSSVTVQGWVAEEGCPVGLSCRIWEALCGREEGKFTWGHAVETLLKPALKNLNFTSRKMRNHHKSFSMGEGYL